MLRLLVAIALLALTLLAAAVAGVVVGVLSGVACLNLFALVLGFRARGKRTEPAEGERWRPSSFRLPPEPPYESEEQAPSLTIHRR